MIYGCTCGGRFRVETTRTSGLHRTRFLVCRSCGGRTSVSVKLDSNGKEIPAIVLRPSTGPFATIASVLEDETV